MSNVTEHYEQLLADHYTWMFGGSMHEKAAEQRELLVRLGMKREGELAVDLGAGPGFQTLALANLGFSRVIAIDTSRKLLNELRAHVLGRPVEALEADMMDLAQQVAPGTADVIVCMGDTLTHLPSRDLIPRLFAAVSSSLRAGGLFVLSYRDLSTELLGLERFIPVRSTADKIMTCFLEYFPDKVMVHDLIQVREGNGWQLLKSCYPKLRLPVDEIRRDLENSGLQIESEETLRGMSLLAARKR